MGRVGLRLMWTVLGSCSPGPRRPLPAMADPPDTPILGISELKFGALYHDPPYLWSNFSVERQTADANFEVLFVPWARTFGGYLRPAIGTSVNFVGGTSKAYADLRWEIEAPSGVFFALGMGAAIHDGELGIVDADHKALGSRVLFHPSAEFGYRFDGVNSISIFADHVSNGFTQRYNEGLDTIGIRYGRRLGPIRTRSERLGTRFADRRSPASMSAPSRATRSRPSTGSRPPRSDRRAATSPTEATRDTAGSRARASSASRWMLRPPGAASPSAATSPASPARRKSAASTAHVPGSDGSSTMAWSTAPAASP